MSTPFIVVDATNGFHLYSNKLNKLSGNWKGKDALAVLCHTIFLQWSSSNSSAFIDQSTGCGFHWGVDGVAPKTHSHLFFWCNQNMLCVVFAMEKWPCFSHFARGIVDSVIQQQALHSNKIVIDTHEALKRMLFTCLREICHAKSISTFGLQISSTLSRKAVAVHSDEAKRESFELLCEKLKAIGSGRKIVKTPQGIVASKREGTFSYVAIFGGASFEVCNDILDHTSLSKCVVLLNL